MWTCRYTPRTYTGSDGAPFTIADADQHGDAGVVSEGLTATTRPKLREISREAFDATFVPGGDVVLDPSSFLRQQPSNPDFLIVDTTKAMTTCVDAVAAQAGPTDGHRTLDVDAQKNTGCSGGRWKDMDWTTGMENYHPGTIRGVLPALAHELN